MKIDDELKINLSRRETRVLLLHEFHLDCKVMERTNNIFSMMDKDLLPVHTAQHWFKRFKNGNLTLDDLSLFGRPLKLHMNLLKQLIEEDP